ncbi:MAG: hypothetical protein AAFZ91_07420 [Pseudomonadota bacterium]
MKPLFLAISFVALSQFAGATEINVTFSEDFNEALEEELGEREGDILSSEIVEDLNRAFERVGVSPTKVSVTIINAKPNRPTFEQLGDRPGLDASRSIAVGGMKLQATAFDAAGNELTELEYGWFESDIRQSVGTTTWSDARRASNRFARKFAEQLNVSQ